MNVIKFERKNPGQDIDLVIKQIKDPTNKIMMVIKHEDGTYSNHCLNGITGEQAVFACQWAIQDIVNECLQ
jgi:hypothetical protein